MNFAMYHHINLMSDMSNKFNHDFFFFMFVFSFLLIYYKIAIILLFLYFNVKNNNEFNIKSLNTKEEYIALAIVLLLYLSIKPLLIILWFLTVIILVKFLYKNFTKKEIKIIQYKEIKKYHDFFINMFIYKHNSIFLTIYKAVSYDKKNNIGFINKLKILYKFIFNIIAFYILGIPKLYLDVAITLTQIILESIIVYDDFYKSKKTIFVIFYIIHYKLKSHFNEKIKEANETNANNTLFINLSKKNGFQKDFIIYSLRKIQKEPLKIYNFPEIKNQFVNYILNYTQSFDNLQNINNPKPNEFLIKNSLKLETISILSGAKKKIDQLHYGLKIKTNSFKKEEYIWPTIYSTEKKEKQEIPLNTEILKGKDFNTCAELCIVNTKLLGIKKEFSESFKKNNEIIDHNKEEIFINKRKDSIKEKLLKEDIKIKVIEKETEYLDFFKNQTIKLDSTVTDSLFDLNPDIRECIFLASKNDSFLSIDACTQKKIIDETLFEVKNIKKEEFHAILREVFSEKEINTLIDNYIENINTQELQNIINCFSESDI